MNKELINANCLDAMRNMPSESVDAVVTDPPYGLAFMGAEWDSFNGSNGRQTIEERQSEAKKYAAENKGAPRYGNSHGKRVLRGEMVAFQESMTPIFAEALRVAKPGAHMLCFGGTRTFHRIACAIEDAGWVIKDCIMWVYGSGMPHGQRVDRLMEKRYPNAAPEWEGWNTQLKPAWEPIMVAYKPFKGGVAKNALLNGTGAMNIDACRVPTDEDISTYGDGTSEQKSAAVYSPYKGDRPHKSKGQEIGRYPANLVHDGSQAVLELFPDSKGQQARVAGNEPSRTGDNGIYGHYGQRNEFVPRGDSGTAARFFYCAKASKKDRNSGCEDYLTWEHDQELTRLLERSSQLLKDISECTMLSQDAGGCSTSLFGSSTMGLSQMECKFITSTVTRLTTESITCNSSQRSNISESILDAIRTSDESGISLARLAERLSHLKQDSTGAETGTVTSAVAALFNALSEIRKLARKGNLHPTVKPNELMRWLVRLVCQQGGTVLDPFMGSGSTGVAAMQEGMSFIGIEQDAHYCEIAERRMSSVEKCQQTLF